MDPSALSTPLSYTLGVLTDLISSHKPVEVSANSIGSHAYIVMAGKAGRKRCARHDENARTDANSPSQPRSLGIYADLTNSQKKIVEPMVKTNAAKAVLWSQRASSSSFLPRLRRSSPACTPANPASVERMPKAASTSRKLRAVKARALCTGRSA